MAAPGYGTAPRLVNGVWVTRRGRTLSAAGQAYWAKKHQQGFVDERGHVNRASVVGTPKTPPGMIEKGNIDIRHRPRVRNPDGSVSTVRSITVTDDNGVAHLIPTVVGKRVVSNDQAIAHWKTTGQHLGRFKTEAQANAYGRALHEQQAAAIKPRTRAPAPTAGVGASAGARATITTPRQPRPPQPSTHEFALAYSNQADRNRPDVKAAIAKVRAYNKAGKKLSLGGVKDLLVGASPLGLIKAAEHTTMREDQAAALQSLATDKSLSPQERARRIRAFQVQQAGIKAPTGLRGLAQKTVEGLVEDAYMTPAGIVYSTKHPVAAAKATGKSVVQTVHHPLQRPDMTLLNAGALIGLAGGVVGRGGAVAGALRAGEEASSKGAAVGAVMKADKHAYGVLTRPEANLPKMTEATYGRIKHPSPQLRAYLAHDRDARAVRKHIVRQVDHEGGIKPLPNKPTEAIGRVIRAGAATKTARVAQAAIRTPRPKERTLTLPGPQGGITVRRLGSRNYFVNVVQRRVMDRMAQHQLNRAGIQPAGRAIGEHIQMTAEEHGPAVARAFNLMNQVHGLRPLDRRVTVLHEPRMGDTLGVHIQRNVGEPYLIQVNPTKGQTSATALHEAGHAVEHTLPKDVVAGIIDTIKKTQTYRNIRKFPGKRARNYFGDPRELWARSYTQYIAEKTGAKDILAANAEYDKHIADHGPPFAPVHWTPEDFAPVKAAYDKAFQDLGLQTRRGAPRHVGLPLAPTAVQKVISPEATIGREARAARRVQDAAEASLGSRLQRFGKTRPAKVVSAVSGGRYGKSGLRGSAHRKRLTAGEQKALDLLSSGASPAEHIASHQQRVDELAAQREALPVIETGAPMVNKVTESRRIRREIQQHRAQIGLTRAAEEALANPRDIFKTALQETRQAIRARERLLKRSGQLTEKTVSHRIGARKVEIQSIATGRDILQRYKAGDITQAEAGQLLNEAGLTINRKTGGLMSPLEQLPVLEKKAEHLRNQVDALGVKEIAPGVYDANEDPAMIQRHIDLTHALANVEDQIHNIHSRFVSQGELARAHGAFYLPSKSLRDLRRTPVGAGRAPSDFGYAPPRTLPELTHTYTGALQRTGNFRTDATGLAADSYRRAQRWSSVFRAYHEMLSASHGTRSSAGAFAIPIRLNVKVPQSLRTVFLRADHGDLTAAEVRAAKTDMEAMVKEMFPDPAQFTQDTIDGVRWLDSRVAGGFGSEFSYEGKIGRAVESFNAPFRAAILYTKPAYAINLLQNIGTNLIRQGVFTPVNMAHALRLGREMGAHDQHMILSLVGEGLSRSLEAEAGVGAKSIHAAGEWWNTVVDRYPRAAAWLHEARTMGFNTPDKIHNLLHDPELRPQLVEVSRRANKEAVEYGQLTPVERNVIKRAIFFYPWLRGATLYTLRFPKEHPIQAAAFANMANYGGAKVQQELGPGPHYLKGSFPIDIGFGRGLVTPSNINTAQTPAQITEGIMGLFGPSGGPTAGDLAQEFGPATAGLYTLATGKTTLGNELPAGKSRVRGALEQLFGSLPEVTAARRISGSGAEGQTNPAKQPIFGKGLRPALGRYALGGFGGLVGGGFNQAAYNARGIKEQKSLMRPGQKVLYGARTLNDEFLSNARAAGALSSTDQLPPALRNALRAQTIRYSRYASLGIKHTQPDYQQKAFQADIKLLRSRNAMSPAEAQQALAWSETAKKDRLIAMRQYLGRKYFQTGVVSDFRHDLKEKGYPVLSRITPP